MSAPVSSLNSTTAPPTTNFLNQPLARSSILCINLWFGILLAARSSTVWLNCLPAQNEYCNSLIRRCCCCCCGCCIPPPGPYLLSLLLLRLSVVAAGWRLLFRPRSADRLEVAKNSAFVAFCALLGCRTKTQMLARKYTSTTVALGRCFSIELPSANNIDGQLCSCSFNLVDGLYFFGRQKLAIRHSHLRNFTLRYDFIQAILRIF